MEQSRYCVAAGSCVPIRTEREAAVAMFVSAFAQIFGRGGADTPSAAVHVHPVDERGEALGSGGVVGVAAVMAGLDQGGIAEDAEVFGDGRLGDAGVGGEVADGEGAMAGQALEDGAAGRVGEGVEGGGGCSGAHFISRSSHNRMAIG